MTGKSLEDSFGLLGYLLDGKYLVEAVISRGGFGLVYRGRHQTLGRPVALKVFAPNEGNAQDPEGLLEAFQREAEIIAKLRHPATVKALDFGLFQTHDGGACPWMAMEWVDGETLRSHLVRRRTFGGRTPAQCFELMAPVLEALAEAHTLGVAHRDLKPHNIMVEDPGIRAGQARPSVRGHPPLRVLDFGIAKAVAPGEVAGTGATQTTGRGAFSPQYAAPEQLTGTRTGPWTDVHALGLILTELLTDRHAYQDARDEALGQEAFAKERPTPGRFGVSVGAWEPVLAKALALRPADRYPHAGALLEALEEALPRASGTSLPQTPPLGPLRPEGAGNTQTASQVGMAVSTLRPSEVPAPPGAPLVGPGLSSNATGQGRVLRYLAVAGLALALGGLGAGGTWVLVSRTEPTRAAAVPVVTPAPQGAPTAAITQPPSTPAVSVPVAALPVRTVHDAGAPPPVETPRAPRSEPSGRREGRIERPAPTVILPPVTAPAPRDPSRDRVPLE